MSNELVKTVFGTDDFDAVAAATGAYSSGSLGLPNLKINRESENEQGQAVPVGTYCVSQDGVLVYAKTAKFRPFLNTYQYMVYDGVANKFLNKSIIIKNFNEQAIDEKGGIRCGKISAKEYLSLAERGILSDSDKVAQKQIKCYRGLYGLLTMEGVIADGTKADLANLPVLWRVSGDSFNAPKEALDVITKIRHLCFQHWLQLDKPERKKQGSNVYYVPTVTAVIDETVEFSTDDMATFSMFQQTIDRENSYVADKWRASKRHETSVEDSSVLADLDLNDDISDI